MLVYANHIPIRSAKGLIDPLTPIADWLSRKVKRQLGTDLLLKGGEVHRRDGWHVHSLVVSDAYPHLASIELIHPDATVSGRRWHSQIGLQQRTADADVDLTVLVQTSEVSARVTVGVSPGAPTFVSDVLERCLVSSAAIGCDDRVLGDDDAEAFRYVVFDPSREHPFVVVSPTRDGKYLVDTALLSRLLIGIAELVIIPPAADTFWLARIVGTDFVPYLGASKIVYPPGTIGHPTVRTVTQSDLASAALDSRAASKELFSLVLHRTNVPLSWKHVSPSRVREEMLRRELERRNLAAVASGNATEYARFMEEYVRVQEAATSAAIEEKRRYAEALDTTHRLADETQRELQTKIDGLRFQLDSAKASTDGSPYAPLDVSSLGETVASAIADEPTPEQCLLLLEQLYSDRVVVLPEAWTSAREASGFKYGRKLYFLLHAFVTEYWGALSAGANDQEARKIFGSSYAAKESEGVATNKGAKRRRTFRYAGSDHLMVKHLKIGVKDSTAETIRVHFEWFAERQRLVIGHCGPHIPFN